jgi:hypothetical protein
MKKRIISTAIYLVAFCICLGSYALLVRFHGNRGSDLAWAVVSLSEFTRHTLGLGWERPGNSLNISTLFACAVIALPFLAVFLLATAARTYFRVAGFVLAIALLYLTFYWFQTPLHLF